MRKKSVNRREWKKRTMKKDILVAAALVGLVLAACGENTSQTRQAAQTETMVQESTVQEGEAKGTMAEEAENGAEVKMQMVRKQEQAERMYKEQRGLRIPMIPVSLPPGGSGLCPREGRSNPIPLWEMPISIPWS